MTPGQCARYGEFLMSALADKLIDAKVPPLRPHPAGNASSNPTAGSDPSA